MKIEFDEQADALYISLRPIGNGDVDETVEIADGMCIDYDKRHKPVGLEIIGISKLKPGDFENFAAFTRSIHTFMTVSEVASLLRADEETIRRKIKRKEIPAINLGGRAGYRIDSSRLMEFMAHPASE